MSNIKDAPMITVRLIYFSRHLAWRTHVRTDGHLTAKTFEIDGLVNFLRYWGSGAVPSAHRSFAKNKRHTSSV